MASGVRPHPSTVVYDPDAVIELATAVKSKEERPFVVVLRCPTLGTTP